MNVGSLFSGIGGLDLGLERAGMTVRWQVENESYCARVLAKHWPEVKRYGDIKKIDWNEVEHVDLICGGFPCQPVSLAGKRRAQADERWLWPEFARCVCSLRPRFVVIENVPGLLSAGMSDVLGDLAASGYDAEWDCIPAAAVGAPHLRYRVFLVAYPGAAGRDGTRSHFARRPDGDTPRRDITPDCGTYVADAGRWHGRTGGPGRSEHSGQGLREQAHETVEHADSKRWGEPQALHAGCRVFGEGQSDHRTLSGSSSERDVPDATHNRDGRRGQQQPHDNGAGGPERSREARDDFGAWWAAEPDVGRVVARVPIGMDGGRIDGAQASGGTREILCALRDEDRAAQLQWPARGYGGIQEAEVLLALLCEHEGTSRPLGHVSLASAEASQVVVRGVWFNGQVACPSCRRIAREQHTREHSDLVRLLSQLLACDCGSTQLDPTGTPSVTSRVDRLRGLGNAVVPQVAEWIGRRLMEVAS